MLLGLFIDTSISDYSFIGWSSFITNFSLLLMDLNSLFIELSFFVSFFINSNLKELSDSKFSSCLCLFVFFKDFIFFVQRHIIFDLSRVIFKLSKILF